MEGEPDWISRMAEEQVIIRQTSGEEADRSSSEGAPEEDTVNTKRDGGGGGVSKIAHNTKSSLSVQKRQSKEYTH